MISPKTAQILKYCGLFLILLIFLPFELSVTLTVSFYLVLNSRNYAKLLIVSLVIFLADIVFRNFDISIRFISDLALDSYILLLSSLFIYLKSQPRIVEYFHKLNRSGRKVFSINTLLMLGVSSIFSILLAPIIGIPFAVISGYISFSYLSKHFEGRYAYAVGLFFLFFCPFFIIAKKDSISENFAIISFYLLIIGTIQEVVGLVQKHKVEQDDRIIHKSFAFSLPKVNFGAKILHFLQSVRLPKKSKLPASQKEKDFIGSFANNHDTNLTADVITPKKFRPVMKLIFITAVTGLLSFTVFSTIITSKTKYITPSVTEKPTISPITPTPTIDAVLELMVENGTEIAGLAASTAAKLKAAGFKNVDARNAARSDYKNWEITTKKDDTVLINHIKQVLKLETLTVIKASESSEFDLLLTAGSELP